MPERGAWSRHGHRAVVAALLATALLVAACGGGDDEGAADAEAAAEADVRGGSDAQDTGSAPDSDAPSDGAGTITLNGEATAVTEVFRCIPASERPDDLDLTAFMEAGGYTIVYVVDGGSTLRDISLNSVDEAVYGSGAFASDAESGDVGTFTVDGNHITGAGTVHDAYGSSASVDVTFDFTFPSEARDCSL